MATGVEDMDVDVAIVPSCKRISDDFEMIGRCNYVVERVDVYQLISMSTSQVETKRKYQL